MTQRLSLSVVDFGISRTIAIGVDVTAYTHHFSVAKISAKSAANPKYLKNAGIGFGLSHAILSYACRLEKLP